MAVCNVLRGLTDANVLYVCGGYCSRRLESLDICDDEWNHVLPAFPGPAELGPAEVGGEPDSVPSAALLHDRFRAVDVEGISAVPVADGAGADAADVGLEEHDVRGGPTAREVPDGVGGVPWEGVDEGGGRADDQRAEQELVVLCGVDPEQREVVGVRHPADGSEDVVDVHRELDIDPRDVQAGERAVHGDVQEEGVLALVHGRRDGRDGVHGGGEQHERLGVGVPAVPGRERGGGGRVRG
jgi:hypothetical protein